MVSNIKMLQASVSYDPINDDNNFRMLVDGKSVKYISIDAYLYSVEDMCFAPALIPMLPPFPPGDWNTGRISRNGVDGRPHFAEVKKVELQGISRVWHPVRIEYLDLCMGDELRSGVYEATHPRFDGPVVVKFAVFPYEIAYFDAETRAYECLREHAIGPRFLGHLTEEGRVVGFVLERIAGSRHAAPEDLGLCQQALLALHGLGMKHGDVNKHNFLIHDGRATLIDFCTTVYCDDAKELEEEYQGLERELSDMSGRGGCVEE